MGSCADGCRSPPFKRSIKWWMAPSSTGGGGGYAGQPISVRTAAGTGLHSGLEGRHSWMAGLPAWPPWPGPKPELGRLSPPGVHSASVTQEPQPSLLLFFQEGKHSSFSSFESWAVLMIQDPCFVSICGAGGLGSSPRITTAFIHSHIRKTFGEQLLCARNHD